jgi:hypothetical protein
MSYTLTLDCGCTVRVLCDPGTKAARSRILERRGAGCPVRKHKAGLRLHLWDLLPDRGIAAGERRPDLEISWM